MKQVMRQRMPPELYNTGGEALHSAYRSVNAVREHVCMPLYRRDLLPASWLYNDRYYRKRTDGYPREVADEFAQTVYRMFEPSSVADFGCAVGHFLHHLYQTGVEVHGYDAHVAAKKYAMIPEDRITVKDLTEPWTSDRQFELGLCLEVLEHIPPEDSATAVQNIVDHVEDILLVSAATPGQGGTHHVNEQPKQHWINQFQQYDFHYDPSLTRRFKSRLNLSSAQKHNLLIFQRKQGMEAI